MDQPPREGGRPSGREVMAAAQKVSGLPNEVCFLGSSAATTTAHIEEALAAVECDVVIIVTPPPMHAVQCRAAIAAGKHVRTLPSQPPGATTLSTDSLSLSLSRSLVSTALAFVMTEHRSTSRSRFVRTSPRQRRSSPRQRRPVSRCVFVCVCVCACVRLCVCASVCRTCPSPSRFLILVWCTAHGLPECTAALRSATTRSDSPLRKPRQTHRWADGED